MEHILKVPVKNIWLAQNKLTKEFVFIDTGMKYDQKMYNLMWSISANEVHELVLEAIK